MFEQRSKDTRLLRAGLQESGGRGRGTQGRCPAGKAVNNRGEESDGLGPGR